MNIGVLSIQGGVREHLEKILELGYNGIEVKDLDHLNKVDKLIIPGGESTTVCKILNEENMLEPLKRKILDGMKVWGTCAGLIILAKVIDGESIANIGLSNITVRRNAFGRQLGSFELVENLEEISISSFRMIFIRAPIITAVGEHVKILKKVQNNIVAVSEDNMLLTAFHPELTDDNRFHKYFIERF